MEGEQAQVSAEPAGRAQGQGLAARIRVNLAGKVTAPTAREMVTLPDSRGCRRESRTWRGNSGASSRKSVPLWARETAPGRTTELPPPTMAATVAVWWGLMNGGLFSMGLSEGSMPATGWIAVTSRARSEERRVGQEWRAWGVRDRAT